MLPSPDSGPVLWELFPMTLYSSKICPQSTKSKGLCFGCWVAEKKLLQFLFITISKVFLLHYMRFHTSFAYSKRIIVYPFPWFKGRVVMHSYNTLYVISRYTKTYSCTVLQSFVSYTATVAVALTWWKSGNSRLSTLLLTMWWKKYTSATNALTLRVIRMNAMEWRPF